MNGEIQRSIFTPGSRPSKLRWWFLKTFTGHYYNEIVVNGRVHRFPGCILVHGDSLQFDFLDGRITLQNRWGVIITTIVDTA